MTEIYSNILSQERFRVSSVEEARDLIGHSESDRGRLLFCPAFRRLQQKAQVFSLESNAAVRSRLTHSLEVSQIGRYISDQVADGVSGRGLVNPRDARSIVNFVETACLMHDIGNPPFGHFGESAIQEWFTKNGEKVLKQSVGTSHETSPTLSETQALSDFLQFDGNPQGLRVVTRLQRNSDEFGLNLTKTTLAAYLKYIRSSSEAESTANFTKKCGFFITEQNFVQSIWNTFNYAAPQRHPLAYIMEAADDIAYCISDIEDSIEKELLSGEKAFAEIYEIWNASKPKSCSISDQIDQKLTFAINRKDDRNREFTYTDFRTSISRILVRFASTQYLTNHDSILNGAAESLLSENSGPGIILKTLKEYCRNNVYQHYSVQKIELAGYAAIYGLIEHFKCLLDCSENRFKSALEGRSNDSVGNKIVLEKKYLALFPKRYIKVYKDYILTIPSGENYAPLEWNARAHLVIDFISGMTDDFSMKTYRELSGMQL